MFQVMRYALLCLLIKVQLDKHGRMSKGNIKIKDKIYSNMYIISDRYD